MLTAKARFIIFICDFLGVVIAALVAATFTAYIAQNILHKDFYSLLSYISSLRFYSFFFFAGSALFLFYNRGHYSRRIPWWSQVRYILKVLLVLFLIDGFLHFAFKYEFSRLWVISSWLFTFIFLLFARQIAKIIGKKLQVWNIDTVVIGSGNNAIETLFAICSESYTGYKVTTLILHKGFTKFDRSKLPPASRDINIIDGSMNYKEFIEANKKSFYIIAPDNFHDFDTEYLLNLISYTVAGYAIVPPIKGFSLYGLTPQYFFGYDLMFLRPDSKIKSPLGKILKRLMDLIICISIMVVGFPLFIILAILVKMDGGPAFFKQKRLGKGEKLFKCWKFRTMKVNAEQILMEILANDQKAKAEWEKDFKLKNDPRITSIGRILRKTSLDELPQLFNILKGDMSLVGPRPIVDAEKKYYGNKMPEYSSIKPGVTGLWQVSGRNDTTYENRVYLDCWYVKNWSLWYDIVILIKTAIVICKRSGAY